tara:strand:+ start:1413 stop:1925 length:513 start_codon:yes stop_codon:yes gene_type:complete
MATYPRITRGLGKLSPSLFSRLMAMLKEYEDDKAKNTVLDHSGQAGLKRTYFLAKITASAAIGGASNRYTYTFTEVVLDVTTGFAVRANGRTGTNALNLCEMSNTATHVSPGVDLESSAYPAGFSMMPIGKCGDGDTVNLVVVMFAVRDAGGVLRSVFSLGNTHDGTACT